MPALCPISQKRIDTNLVRIISFQILVFILLFIATNALYFLLIVLFDFAVRVVRQDGYSPFRQIAYHILSGWNIKPHYVDESPKRFSLFLGFGMIVFIALFALLGFVNIAVIISLVFILCLFLEVLFSFCIGCKLYYVLQLLKGIKHDRNFH
ncbi:MAG: DUF4395 domain-containing protein [Sulfurovum sp.]|nr:DUF4395 domain-containing protein [Sulfurovum sp.]